MTKDVMISMLRRGKNGEAILRILDRLTGDESTTVSTIEAEMPDPGYIITWDGRQVAF